MAWCGASTCGKKAVVAAHPLLCPDKLFERKPEPPPPVPPRLTARSCCRVPPPLLPLCRRCPLLILPRQPPPARRFPLPRRSRRRRAAAAPAAAGLPAATPSCPLPSARPALLLRGLPQARLCELGDCPRVPLLEPEMVPQHSVAQDLKARVGHRPAGEGRLVVSGRPARDPRLPHERVPPRPPAATATAGRRLSLRLPPTP